MYPIPRSIKSSELRIKNDRLKINRSLRTIDNRKARHGDAKSAKKNKQLRITN